MPLSSAWAEFSLNFVPQGAGTIRTDITHGGCMGGLSNQTAFLLEGGCFAAPEIVTDPDNGLDYWHMIVGTPSDGFIQESFIEVGAVASGQENNVTISPTDNGHDPLGVVTTPLQSGNGMANPRKMIMRQIVSDGEIMMEFLKDEYLKKPLISQVLVVPEVTSMFLVDMRNSTYDDNTSPGTIINTLTLPDEIPLGDGNFDMATDSDRAYVTAGRFIYTDGTGQGGTDGTYDYVDGGYDHTLTDWASFMDPNEDNPWGYTDFRPN